MDEEQHQNRNDAEQKARQAEIEDLIEVVVGSSFMLFKMGLIELVADLKNVFAEPKNVGESKRQKCNGYIDQLLLE